MSTQKLIMLVGLPASGKSTLAKKFNPTFKIFSTDEYRKHKFGDAAKQEEDRGIFFQEFHNHLFAEWKKGTSIIYDATNLSFKRRRAFLRELRMRTPEHIEYTTECHLVVCPYEKCLARNQKRERTVPENVMLHMLKSFQCPSYAEGWDEIILHYTGVQGLRNEMTQCRFFDQQSPHHLYNLLTHCYLTEKLASLHYSQHLLDIFPAVENNVETLIEAGKILTPASLYHDIGKRRAQVFYDKKGNLTKEAHYYGHECIGAYLWLCDRSMLQTMELEQFLQVALLIQNHLVPQNLKTQAEVSEWAQRRGVDGLMLWCLHQADREAHGGAL